ncbi:MAG: DUF4255 domain-containing protein [Bacteroidota bacterium]
MALADLSLVTRSMTTLLEQAFVIADAWSDAPPTILPEPPSRVTENGLGFYLYHVKPNPSYQNTPALGQQGAPKRFTHLALNLYYQLSANSLLSEESQGAFDEQLMMGIAMKALHDYPRIDDTTVINGVAVMQPLLRGRDNRFEVSMQAIPYHEAVQFWTAGTAPVKLSAYYELSVVLLEPDTLDQRTSRVLQYGLQTFVHQAPRLHNSQNILSFTRPGTIQPTNIKLQPAQAPPAAGTTSLVYLWGSSLGGDRQEVLLNGRWDSWDNQSAVSDNSWNISSQGDRLQFELPETATLENGNPVNLLPGVYGLQVRITRYRTMPDGQSRAFPQLSNQIPITITPRIDTVNPPGGDNFYEVIGYRWVDTDLDSEQVQVLLQEQALTAAADPLVLAEGEFGLMDAATLRFRLPAGTAPGTVLSLRIIVNGAESPPQWITSP